MGVQRRWNMLSKAHKSRVCEGFRDWRRAKDYLVELFGDKADLESLWSGLENGDVGQDQ